jgi:fructose-specific component phosphotransferase system IIB-like protein
MPRFTEYNQANTPLNSDDIVIIEQGGVTKRVNVGQLIVGTANPDAIEVTFDPTGLSNVTDTNVQDVIAQLDAALDALAVAGVSDGDKGDITVTGSGTVWTIDNGVVSDSKLGTGIDAAKLANGSVSNTEFQYLDGVTSAIQTQIDGKANTTHNHIATDVTDFVEAAQDAIGAMVDTTLVYTDATPLLSRAAISGDITIAEGSNTAAITSGVIVNADINATAGIDATKIAGGSVSNTEFDYLDGVTSAIQTQLNAKAPLNSPTFTGTVVLPAGQIVNGVTLSTTDGTSVFLRGDGTYASPTAAAAWGSITGTLSSQTDLQSALDGKSSTSHTHTASAITDFSEAVDDRVAALLVEGANISLTYDDTANTLTIAAAGSSGVADGDKGDITVSSSGAVWTIDNGVVTDAKLVDMAEATIKGRAAGAGTGDPTDLSASQVRTILNVADGATANTGTVTSVAVTVPTGLEVVSGSPITGAGTIALGLQTGYVIPLQTTLDGKQATITGAATTITSSNLTASRALASDGSGKVAVSSVTATELGYVSGVTSAIQTQLNAKQATVTGAATTITGSNLTASRALTSDGSGKVAVSSVTSTELGYVSGVTSAIQTQLNAKEATITGAATTITGSNLTASRALSSDGSGKVAASSVTATELGYVSGVTSAIQTQLNAKAATSQTLGISAFIETPDNKDYTLLIKAPFGGTITEVTTRSASGTCTATVKINTTALGGTANSVSSTEQSQSHASANVFVAGDDIVVTVSSNSTCADMRITIQYTRTLA